MERLIESSNENCLRRVFNVYENKAYIDMCIIIYIRRLISSSLLQVVWLTAVLCMRLVAASSNQTLNFSSRKPRDHHLGEQFSRW